MPLTPAQLAVLHTDILNDAALNAEPNIVEGNTVIAAAYNAVAVPDFWVWRTWLNKTEITNAPSQDGTTFTWTGNGFITRSVGELTAWRELFDSEGMVNPSLLNVRQAFQDIFSGTGNAAANRAHLLVVARRKATRLEALLATGTGTTAAPALLQWEGAVYYWEIEQARILP